MNLTQIKQVIKRLNPEQREKLSDWLQALVDADHDKQKQSTGENSEASGERQNDHRTYRKEMVRCGKENCKCNDGKLHGPYYYAYWSEKGVTKSQYIGKKPPHEVKGKR
jgi:hypothetical protein